MRFFSFFKKYSKANNENLSVPLQEKRPNAKNLSNLTIVVDLERLKSCALDYLNKKLKGNGFTSWIRTKKILEECANEAVLLITIFELMKYDADAGVFLLKKCKNQPLELARSEKNIFSHTLSNINELNAEIGCRLKEIGHNYTVNEHQKIDPHPPFDQCHQINQKKIKCWSNLIGLYLTIENAFLKDVPTKTFNMIKNVTNDPADFLSDETYNKLSQLQRSYKKIMYEHVEYNATSVYSCPL